MTLTDPHGKVRVFQYIIESDGSRSKETISEATDNLLDIFKDDPATSAGPINTATPAATELTDAEQVAKLEKQLAAEKLAGL